MKLRLLFRTAILSLLIVVSYVFSSSYSFAAPNVSAIDVTPVNITVFPKQGMKYGVAQLVTIRFTHNVTNKSNVEQSIDIVANKALPEGEWGWLDDYTMVYRPKTFWPANTRISFKINLANVSLEEGKSYSYVGSEQSDKTFVLNVGRQMKININANSHRLFVTKNGKIAKRFPTSLGKRGWETYSGVKVISEDKTKRLQMFGGAKGERWNVIAPWSIRLTQDGEFLHGAPWNTNIGRANTSHGCTNLRVKDAKWLYKNTVPGDPVITKGTGRKMSTTNGTPGAYWNYSWSEWQKL